MSLVRVHAQPSSPKRRVCMCGQSYPYWRVTGGYAPAQHNVLSAPSFMCERCFRLATSRRRLDFGTTGVHEGACMRDNNATTLAPQSEMGFRGV